MNQWEHNLRILRARKAGIDLLPPLPQEPPELTRMTLLPGSAPSLQVPGEKGRPVTMHSPANPWKEAEDLAAQTLPNGDGPIIALGLGMGYHLLALLPRLAPETRLVVVEGEAEVLWAALANQDLEPLLSRPQTILVVSSEAGEAVRHLKTILNTENGGRPPFYGHPPSLRAGNSFYEAVIRGLSSPPRYRGVRGLKKEKLKVLVVNPDYFLIPEVMRGLRNLGHEASLVLFDKRREEGGAVLRRILARLGEMSPDLVFTVNHLGFDREGVLVETLDRLRIPSVSWYVDSPALILDLYEGPKSESAFIFVWDATYVEEVKARGFAQAYGLPLATDPEIFRPQAKAARRPWRSQVAFVGNSMMGSVEQKLARLPGSPEFQALVVRLTKACQARPCRFLRKILQEEGWGDDPLIISLTPGERVDLEAAVVFGATKAYRLACLEPLTPFKPVIYGDPGWRGLLGEAFRLQPEVNYYGELPAVYGAAAVNFNATSLQMRTAVNQRVFDAPAAGGFLLTDFKEQLAELFEPGKDVICYQDPGEIPELASFYLRHGQARRQVVARARARILAEHTYTHRLRRMMEILRRAA